MLRSSKATDEEPNQSEVCDSMNLYGAEAGTRTPMGVRPLRPERSASTNSATSA